MSEAKHSPLPSSFEETIDFVYEVQNMADATERAVVLWPVISLHHELVAALEATLCELSHCATQLAARGLTGHKDDSVSRAQAAARAVLQKAKQGDKQ